jgi:hypothetical protein
MVFKHMFDKTEKPEQFSFPTDKLGIVKKTYNTVVQQHFRAPQ